MKKYTVLLVMSLLLGLILVACGSETPVDTSEIDAANEAAAAYSATPPTAPAQICAAPATKESGKAALEEAPAAGGLY
jgi:hypothetical protein